LEKDGGLAFWAGQLQIPPSERGLATRGNYRGDLSSGVDPRGENGEFHSFVYDGPIFQRPFPRRVGITVVRDGRYYADLLSEKDKSAAAMQPAN